jgi:hypothetical protein
MVGFENRVENRKNNLRAKTFDGKRTLRKELMRY